MKGLEIIANILVPITSDLDGYRLFWLKVLAAYMAYWAGWLCALCTFLYFTFKR